MAKITTLPHLPITYQLFSDAYYGVNGFENGAYLEQHERESNDKYIKRKNICYYANYVKTTIDSHVNPVFKKNAERDLEKTSAMFDEFLNNADGNGTPIANFMKKAALMSKIHGFALIVVDNHNQAFQTRAEEKAAGVMPYCYIVSPSSIVSYEIEKTGQLKEITFKEIDPVTNQSYEKTWTKTSWSTNNTEGALMSGEHNLGSVPVVILASRLTTDIFPPSEFNQIVKANYNLFNKCSWKDEILRNQTFPVLTYPKIGQTDLTIGTDNALTYDGEVSKFAPSFIAPPSDPANLIMQDIKDIIQEIYRQAALSHVTGVQEQASGISKEWDYETTNTVLADFAGNLEMAEMQIAGLFKLWSKETFEYTASYPRNFGIADIATELDNATKAVELQFGTSFKIEVCRKIIAIWFPKMTEEEISKILGEVEEKQRELDKAMSENGNYINNGDDGGGSDNGTV